MRILTTGSNGFIAKHLCSKLEQAGHEVIGIDRANGSDICGDLPEISPDIVFHLAARHHIPTCEVEAKDCIETNVWGTLNLIRKYKNARFINISSSSVNEIKSVYGLSKACAELSTRLHNNCLTVRFYNVFGDGQLLEGGAAVPKFLHHFWTNKPLTVYGNGEQARDFTYVGDVVHNLIKLAFSDRTGLAEIGYSDPITVNGIIKMIYGYMPDITYLPARKEDILYSKSKEKCEIVFGREKGIDKAKEWFKGYYKI